MKYLLGLLAALYVFVCIVTYVSQRRLIYLPFKQRVDPAEVGLESVDEFVLVTAAGERLYCWWGEPQPGRPTILFFHGNGGSLAHRTDRYRQWMDRGFGVFALGYPGYGGSDGSPSERSFVSAAKLAYDHLVESGVTASELVIYGESLGSAVAVQIAAQNPSKALVLEAPMSSVLDVAKKQFPYLPVSLLLKDKYLSKRHIGRIDVPVLIMHGEHDSIVPIASGRALFEHAKEPRKFIAIEGAGHNDLTTFPTVDYLVAFLE